jgi:PBSX family phage terminase large subunit
MTAYNHILTLPEAYEQVWHSKKPYQIWYGGRGSAKSWSKAIYFLTKALRPEYCRVIFARDTQKNVRNSQYQLFKDIVGKFDCFKDQFVFVESPALKITCRQTGNMLMGGSFEQPDTLRSVADPTDFWAEEPITRENEIKRQDFFDIVGSLRNSYGIQPQFHFTFNPISKQTWIYRDFFESKLYDVETLFVNYWDNPYCPESTKTFLESLKILDPKRYEVDALGNWGVAYEGLIYPDYEFVDVMPGEPDFYGLDFGFNDPCALTAGKVLDIFEQPKKDYIVQEMLYETGHTSATLINRFQQLGVSKMKKIICDNARPEMIMDLKRAGYRAEPCFKYQGSVRDGINEVKKYNLRIVKGSRNLCDEISTYCWDSKDETLLDEPADSIDHAMDAMRYALEAVRKPDAKFYTF